MKTLSPSEQKEREITGDYQRALMRHAPAWVREECYRLYLRTRTRRAYSKRNRRLLKATTPAHMADAYAVYHRDTPTG